MDKTGGLLSVRNMVQGVLMLCLLGVLLHTRLFQPPIDYDDAYVHFRTALNIAHGHGPVFNPGEKVLGSTSPVFATILGGLHWLTEAPMPHIARVLNLLVEMGTTLICLLWMRRCGVRMLFRYCAAFVLLLEPYRMSYSLGGMEMSLFILLSMVVFELCKRGWWAGAGIILGILGWVRPEAVVVWLAVIGTFAATRRFRELAKVMAVALPVSAVTALLLIVTAGSAIPQSVLAKHSAPWFGQCNDALLYFIRLGDLTPLLSLNGCVASWGTFCDKINTCVSATAALVVVATGVIYMIRRGQGFIGSAVFLFTLGQYLFYAMLRPAHFQWYYVPYFFGILLLSMVGWYAVGCHVYERLSPRMAVLARNRQIAYVLACVVFAGVFKLWASFWISDVTNDKGSTFADRQWLTMREPLPDVRAPSYSKVAEVLNSLDTTATIGCTEIGIIGFHYEGRIFDAYGLVSPEALNVLQPNVLAALPAGCRAFPVNTFTANKPELIVSYGMFMGDITADFMKRYDAYEFASCYVFARKDYSQKLRDDKRFTPMNPMRIISQADRHTN